MVAMSKTLWREGTVTIKTVPIGEFMAGSGGQGIMLDPELVNQSETFMAPWL